MYVALLRIPAPLLSVYGIVIFFDKYFSFRQYFCEFVPLLSVGRGLGVDLLLRALLVSQELWVHLFGGLVLV